MSAAPKDGIATNSKQRKVAAKSQSVKRTEIENTPYPDDGKSETKCDSASSDALQTASDVLIAGDSGKSSKKTAGKGTGKGTSKGAGKGAGKGAMGSVESRGVGHNNGKGSARGKSVGHTDQASLTEKKKAAGPPEDAPIRLYNAGVVARDAGDSAEARRLFTLAAEKNHPKAIHNLAVLTQEHDPESAIALYRKVYHATLVTRLHVGAYCVSESTL